MRTVILEKYCYNCDNKAVVFVEWTPANSSETHRTRTYMCQTCADAFELGQCTPEPLRDID
jgi:protein-arginine kinase activator protein McsA